jgi:hypothetical protein
LTTWLWFAFFAIAPQGRLVKTLVIYRVAERDSLGLKEIDIGSRCLVEEPRAGLEKMRTVRGV